MAELPFRKRMYFGLAGFSMVVPDLIIMQWLLVRYVPPEGEALIPPAICGALILCGRMAEGLTGPILAHWSDNCRHRWGRRMPFLRFGIFPYLAVFFLMFNPPDFPAHWLHIPYLFVLVLAYFPLYNVVFTPYLALLPELTRDPKERVDLTTIQAVCMMVGMFFFAGVGTVLEYAGWAGALGLAVFLMALFFAPLALGIRERGRTEESDGGGVSFWTSVRRTLSNRPFRYVIASTSLYFFALNGILLLVPYWVVAYLDGTEADVTKLMLPYLLMNLVFFFVFNTLAARLGKHPLMLATFLGTGVVLALMPLVGLVPLGSRFVQSAAVIALVGAPVAGFMILPYAVLADVVDHEARKTGQRREGVFFGVQGFVQKLMIGLSVLMCSFVPYLGSEDGRPSVFGLKLVACFCAAACMLSFIVFLGYPLRENTSDAQRSISP